MYVCGTGKDLFHDALVRKSHTQQAGQSVMMTVCLVLLSSICSLSMVITHAHTHARAPSSAAQGHIAGRVLSCDLYSTSRVHTQTHSVACSILVDI